jgi:predicted metal-dependent hydrolase
MNIKDIVKNTMEKLYKQLNNFKDHITNPNNLNINESVINNELDIAKHKYDDYKSNKFVQDNVNKYITDIYQKKVENTYKKYKDFARNKDGF